MNISVKEADRGLPPDADGDRLAQDGSTGTASKDSAGNHNQLVKEVHNLIRAGGMTPDENDLTQLMDILIPAGKVESFACALPTGYLPCDGAAVSRTTYARLFAAIGTTFGVGDGSTTFKVPFISSRTIVGSGTGSGLTARTLGQMFGAETHQLTKAEMPDHYHTNGNAGNMLGDGTSGVPANIPGGGSSSRVLPLSSFTVQGHSGTAAAHNNVQPSIVLNFGIRY